MTAHPRSLHPATIPASPEFSGSIALRVVCWNLHGCVGTDRRRDPLRVAKALAALSPDVVGLQEVDLRRHPGEAEDPLTLIARTTGMRAVHSPTLERDGGAYGNAILSRWPVVAALPLDLSVPGCEPRRAMDATLEHPAGPLRVMVTHLGLGRKERRWQVGRLGERLSRPLAGADGRDAHHPLILMGDFNEWLPWGQTAVAGLKTWFDADCSRRSFPSWLPVLRLDRLLVRPSPRRLT
ncbi:endonuclease, partial [Rhodospirillum rubrum]|uniref:endonuclease/exonuclease/phosphatase family protein n=2 Tax=Rhodospirillum rubrum TaxID=1085 RepID=UPI0019079356